MQFLFNLEEWDAQPRAFTPEELAAWQEPADLRLLAVECKDNPDRASTWRRIDRIRQLGCA
jgi:hypothetical protein